MYYIFQITSIYCNGIYNYYLSSISASYIILYSTTISLIYLFNYLALYYHLYSSIIDYTSFYFGYNLYTSFYSPFIYFMASYTISFIDFYGLPICLLSTSIAILSHHYIYYLPKYCFYFLLNTTYIIKHHLPHLSFKCSPSYLYCYAY